MTRALVCFSSLLCRFGQCQPPQRQPHNHLSWQWKHTAISQQHFNAFPDQAAECDSTARWARFSVHYHFHSRWTHSFRAAGRKTNLLCICTQPGPGERWQWHRADFQHGQPSPAVIQMENSSGWALGKTPSVSSTASGDLDFLREDVDIILGGLGPDSEG